MLSPFYYFCENLIIFKKKFLMQLCHISVEKVSKRNEKKNWGLLSEKNTFFHFLWTSSARLQLFLSGAQYITKCLPKTMIEKIITVRSRILEFFFWEALSNLWRLFLAHFLVESNGILSQLSGMVQHLYLGWKNKGSRAPNFFNPFYFKIHAFLNHSKTDVFHPP